MKNVQYCKPDCGSARYWRAAYRFAVVMEAEVAGSDVTYRTRLYAQAQ